LRPDSSARARLVLSLLSVGAAFLWACAAAEAPPAPARTLEAHYPGQTWERADAARLGWSIERLNIARAYSDGLGSAAVFIVQHGMVIDAWGDFNRKLHSHSMRKSLIGALFGIFVAEGRISTEETLAELGIDDAPPLTPEESRAKVIDLLRSRSGVYHLAQGETPGTDAERPARGSHSVGTYFWYNNWDFNVLATILAKKVGATVGDLFERRLAAPLQMQDFHASDFILYAADQRSIHGTYSFEITARDLARFGLLYLREGVWKGAQIVPREWVRASTHADQTIDDKRGGYGLLWWVERGGVHFPGVDLGGGSFSARGYRGHYLVVIPSLDLVVVHRVDSTSSEVTVSEGQFGHFLKLLLDAAPR
jgi:CubicO group peptidase (beta-lactamase class C family)